MASKVENRRSERSFLTTFVLYGSILIVAMGIILMLIPSNIDPLSYELPSPPSFTGPLSQNEVLKSAETVLKNVHGPESMVFHEGFMYTGTGDGKILKINRNKQATVLTRFGHGDTPLTRGRPLGLRLDSTKTYLFVADAFLGIFKVNIKTGRHEKIFPFDDKDRATFLDDLEILPNGDLLVSEASTKFLLNNMMDDMLESGGSGRLLRIDYKNQRYEVVLDNLFFPNGVQLDLKNEDAVLVAETQRDRVRRIYFQGPQKGKSEWFVENLPGTPDNIRPSESRDGYWIAIGAVRSKEVDIDFHRFRNRPQFRSFASKIFPYLSQSMQLKLMLRKKYTLIVKVDLDGKFVESLHGPSGNLPLPTEVKEYSGALFIGNFDSVGIAYLKRKCEKNCFFH